MTTFTPERIAGAGSKEPPCRLEMWARWRLEEASPPSPFRSLRVERAVYRVQPFSIR